MIIEKANQTNLDDVTRLAMMLWPDHLFSDLRIEFEEMLESEKDIVFLAVVAGNPVGFIHMSLRVDYVEGATSSPVGYVEGIYVEELHRKKGISKRLVQEGERWARSLGCKEIASDTSFDNYGSQEFHKKIGFREAGRIVAFIKELKE